MHTKNVDKSSTPKPEPSWPTVAIKLSRPGEPQESIFSQIEKTCPMGRGQRCLVLAPSHGAISAFLTDLCERIRELNVGVDSRLLRMKECGSATVVEELADGAQQGIQDGRHSVFIIDSLNTVAAGCKDALASCNRFFGTAKATTKGGTLTVVAVAVDPPTTDLDREILGAFRGTGNMELAIRVDERHNTVVLDAKRSGTKHPERIHPAA